MDAPTYLHVQIFAFKTRSYSHLNIDGRMLKGLSRTVSTTDELVIVLN